MPVWSLRRLPGLTDHALVPLNQSDRLGPYEILGQIGAGGMGEVYRARDTRLNRIVAIKVLPGGLEADPVLGRRFRREAEALATLNHPHICTVHDVGGEPPYLVMEYLDGDTLDKRLSRGPLPVPEALEYAAALADALDTAHRAGVVHRDVKPSNIVLTEAGAKLLDFGLARPALPRHGEAGALTAAADLTEPGIVLGTLQYMAPEQIRGEDADARTDIFSFGAVLYEMVTGVKPFSGKNSFSLMASILEHDPPPMSALQPQTPAALDSLVAICLAKRPRDRWQSARDVTLQLERIVRSGVTSRSDRPARSRGRLAWWLVAASVLALLAIGLSYVFQAPSPRPAEGIAFSIPAPDQSVTRMQLDPFTTVSPDGRHIAFTVQQEGDGGRLWVRSLDSPDARMLAGTEGAFIPFWSPDSLEIGLFSTRDYHLKAVPYAGGSVRVLCPAPSPLGGTWSSDGTILFSAAATSEYTATSLRASGVHRVSAAGGEPTLVPLPDRRGPEAGYKSRYGAREAWPHFLPDGSGFLYLDRDSRTIVVGSLDSAATTPLLNADSQAIYSATGHLLFVREGTLMGQVFDARRLRLQGEPFRVAENVRYDADLGGAVFSASDNGVLAYSSGTRQTPSRAVWMDRSGQVLGAPRDFGATVYRNRLFRDDNRLAQERPTSGEVSDIWLLDLARGRTIKVTSIPADEEAPVASPDGTEILYASNENGVYDLYRIPATGSGRGEVVYHSSHDKFPYDWSIEGRIAFTALGQQTRRDIWLLDSISSTEPRLAVGTTASEDQPRFSPDGRWLAYRSDRTGRYEVYIQPLESDSPVVVSVDGGSKPFWRHDGRELFFVSSDDWMSAVEVRFEPRVDVGSPRRLFRIPAHCTHPRCFDAAVTRDGRFLVVTADALPDTPMRVLVNWISVLNRERATTR
jgi:serine/threonine protein kinase/Tol biopolymer transport system component